MGWRHRGFWIERDVYTGDYYVWTNVRGPGQHDRDLVFSRSSKHGLKQTKADIDAIFAAEEQAEREAEIRRLAQLQREYEAMERARLWLRELPSNTCPKCGARVVVARTGHGHRIPLDAEPNPEGDWTPYACTTSRVPLVRRVAGERTADRYEVHAATCPARPALADPSGQLRLRLGRHAHSRARSRGKEARTRHRQLALTTTAQAEQLELPCASPTANPAAPTSGGQ